jgi:hypothetical protein
MHARFMSAAKEDGGQAGRSREEKGAPERRAAGATEGGESSDEGLLRGSSVAIRVSTRHWLERTAG